MTKHGGTKHSGTEHGELRTSATTTLDRRQFSSAIVAGCAASAMSNVCLTPRALSASDVARGPLRFVVVSDTHLGYRDQTAAVERWQKTADELADAPGDLILHLGDVVDGGRSELYPTFREIRDAIGKPVPAIPGNHDEPEAFARELTEPIDRVVELEWLRFLLLNNARRDSHDGFISAGQLEWLARELESAGRAKRLIAIAMHVPAHANKHPDRGWYVKPDQGQRALYDLLEQHRDRVLMLMHGHFHNGIRGWQDHGLVHEVTFPSVLYNQDRRLEMQQAPGYNLPEFRPGYTQIEVANGEIRMQYKPIGNDPPVAPKNLKSALLS
ncbi:MAG: metallophosphoesterase [Planctomycetales bacterium]|nr:metallophosphoesterase [Planctomycetales bacterium]